MIQGYTQENLGSASGRLFLGRCFGAFLFSHKRFEEYSFGCSSYSDLGGTAYEQWYAYFSKESK